jgi:hypothetical protein
VVEPRNEGLEFDASILSALAVELALERNPISTCFTEHRSGINTAMFCAANVVSSSADTTRGHLVPPLATRLRPPGGCGCVEGFGAQLAPLRPMCASSLTSTPQILLDTEVSGEKHRVRLGHGRSGGLRALLTVGR